MKNQDNYNSQNSVNEYNSAENKCKRNGDKDKPKETPVGKTTQAKDDIESDYSRYVDPVMGYETLYTPCEYVDEADNYNNEY